jgi:hypothetical protein
MDRKEARELFFEFMKTLRDEFPLFRGDNLLLFELKSHYFLYLCKYGNLDFLREKQAVAVGEAPPADFLAAKPRVPDGNTLIDLPYDLRTISETLNDAECAVLKPRYQSGNFKEKLFNEMAAQVAAAPPVPTHAIFRARSSDLLQIGKDAARLLRAADGTRTVAAILAEFAEPQRPKVERFLKDLFTRGLLTASAAKGPPVAAPRAGARRNATANDLEITASADARARVAETLHLHCKPSAG